MWTSDEWCVCYICLQPTADRDRHRGTNGDKLYVRKRESHWEKKGVSFFLIIYYLEWCSNCVCPVRKCVCWQNNRNKNVECNARNNRERERKILSKYRMKTAKYERWNRFYMRSWPIFGHYSRADSGTAHLIVLAIHTVTFDPKGQTKWIFNIYRLPNEEINDDATNKKNNNIETIWIRRPKKGKWK